MGQVCGKASLKEGGDVYSHDVQRLEETPPVQVVGSWQVPSKPSPLGRPPMSPPRDPPNVPSKKVKKSKSKKDKEKKGFRGTLDAWSSFGSFNGSVNERQGKEKRVGILGFEVANLVMKMMNLRMALFEEELARFKEEVILSEASRKLISEDEATLWTIAALDRRRELAGLTMDVARLGKQSSDTDLQNLDKKFASLGLDGEVRPKLSPSEVDANIEWLQEQIASTADLYHELLALDTVTASLRRAQAEEEQFPGTQKESVVVLKQEAKEQERLVRSLKKKGLWSKKLDHILEVLVELVYAVYEQLVDAFFPEVMEETLRPAPKNVGHPNELGVQGLSLHYANIISSIDRMVSRPNSVSPASRDALYQMLPQSIKASLRDEISKPLEDGTIAGIRRNLDIILDVVTPVAGNTVRWCSDRRLQGHSDLCLMQTLHHADQSRTESLLLDLVVNLHHLMSRAKNPLNPSGKSPNRTPSRSPITTPPRVFPAPGANADVAEALAEIPVHLRASVEPSLIERADTILAKLDAFRTEQFGAGRTVGGRLAEVGNVKEDGVGRRNGAQVAESTTGVALAATSSDAQEIVEEILENGSVVEAIANGGSSSEERRGSRSPIRRILSGERPDASTRVDGPKVTSAGAAREGQENDGQTPDATPAVRRDMSDTVAGDDFESPPGWGLGILRKSMSVKRNGGHALGGKEGGVLRAENGSEGSGFGSAELRRTGSSGVPRFGEVDAQILPKGWHPADRILEGEDGGAFSGLRSGYDGLRGNDVDHLMDRLEADHAGAEPSRAGMNDQSGVNGARLSSNHGGLREEEVSRSWSYGYHNGEHSRFAGGHTADDLSPGLRSEVSLDDGIGVENDGTHSDSLKVRNGRVSSGLYQSSGLEPNGASRVGNNDGLTPNESGSRQSGGGLHHGFGSDLQIGEVGGLEQDGSALSMKRSGEQEPATSGVGLSRGSNGRLREESRLADGEVPARGYSGDFARLTHRSSDPGTFPKNPHAPSNAARSNSYSGPPDPGGGRKSRFSVEGAAQGHDARSSSENSVHGLGPPPSRKSGELRNAHDVRKLSEELRKLSGGGAWSGGELKSPGSSSKRLGYDALGSPKTPRRTSPNSRSLHRRTHSKTGSSMTSPRSLEPLSPAGVIDIDLIDI